MCGKSKQGVKRDMPMEAPIVAEQEFIEIAVDVLAAQAVICAEAPSLHQRESAMNPRQDNVARHLADDAWIVPIAGQPRIGRMAICDQRSSARYIGSHEGGDRRSGIVGDHSEPNAARTRAQRSSIAFALS